MAVSLSYEIVRKIIYTSLQKLWPCTHNRTSTVSFFHPLPPTHSAFVALASKDSHSKSMISTYYLSHIGQ